MSSMQLHGGSNDYLQFTMATGFAFNSNISIGFWVKVNTQPTTYECTAAVSSSLTLNSGPRFQFQSNGSGTAYIPVVNGQDATSPPSMTVGQWLYLGLCMASNGQPSGYYQVGSGGTMTAMGTFSVAGTGGTILYVKIGSYEDGSGPVAMSVRDFRIWKGQTAVFGASDFTSEAASHSPHNTTNLFLSWPLSSATDLTDQSGNSNTPSAHSGATITTDSSDPLPSNSGSTPGPGSLTTSGNTPAVTRSTNTVISPFVARSGDILLPTPRIILPRESHHSGVTLR